MFAGRMHSLAMGFGVATLLAGGLLAQDQTIEPLTIEKKTASMNKLDGYFPIYWDEQEGRLWLEITRFNDDFLYVTSLAAGLGSNDIGLDRGALGDGAVVYFERVGKKILLVRRNETFRSASPNAAERRSVEDSFATSIIGGFSVAASTGNRVLVDATKFFLSDQFGAAAGLKGGNYKVDADRSAPYITATKAFPKNTEIEVILTFAKSSDPGFDAGFPQQGPRPIGQGGGRPGAPQGQFTSGTVASVTPDVQSVTLREHFSMVQLPDAGFRSRRYDPRAGYLENSFVDYSVPVGEPIEQRYIIRHRLEKKDPSAAVSDPVQPIRYYVDSGAPEDVKKALLEGAGWWNQAFAAAGFRNAFQVEVLPDGADPMDIRYNMINWVHRSTRGWSTGGSIVDPRTGEIIKATVTLGSLRDRQDFLISEGLLSPYQNGGAGARSEAAYQTAIARIRQLAAHEVGHTLGLGHNYYDSTQNWISVMDYPHPLETLRADGTIDLTNAYPARIGEWDKTAIEYGYRQFPAGADESAELRKIIDDAWARDIRYMTNQDLGVHPRVDQWSNGVNQADELQRIMKVRRSALDRLGETTIRNGAPMATIEEPLVPIFMYHRYTVESAAASIGGVDYIYALRGDGRAPLHWETAANQRKALNALAETLKASELTIPAKLLASIPPRPPAFERHRELFPRTTGPAFDPISPGSIAADVTIGFVLQLDRASRMVAQHAEDSSLPGLEEVIDRLVKVTFDGPAASEYEAEIRRAEERVLVDRVAWLASGSPNAQVRAIAFAKLNALATRLTARMKTARSSNSAEQAHRNLLAADLKRYIDRPAEPVKAIVAPDAPPGAPIGDVELDWLARPAY